MSDTRKGLEFPKPVKVAAIKRATVDGVIRCDLCGGVAMRHQVDHRIAIAIGGKPTLENAQIICEPCYSVKNSQDATLAAKTKRQEAKHLGVKTPSASIQSAGFAPVDKATKRTNQSAANAASKIAGLGPSNLARRFRAV